MTGTSPLQHHSAPRMGRQAKYKHQIAALRKNSCERLMIQLEVNSKGLAGPEPCSGDSEAGAGVAKANIGCHKDSLNGFAAV